jgi:hypothetical protein
VGWLAATDRGLIGSDGRSVLDGRDATALAPDADGWLVLLDGHEVVRVRGTEVETIGTVSDEVGRCLLAVPAGVLVGTGHARLALIEEGTTRFLAAFDDVEGRDDWYTPWGGPPDTRSLASSSDATIFANVHVGGIPRGNDPDGPWTPTIDVDADVHQVVVDPSDPSHVVAATALGLAESDDAGGSWTFVTEGLHASYARAVAIDGDRSYLSASTGPRGGRAAVYRRRAGGGAFERCDGSLPEWFAGNIDSHRLAAAGGSVVFASEDGSVFLSEDAGDSWREALEGSARIRAVCLGTFERPGS